MVNRNGFDKKCNFLTLEMVIRNNSDKNVILKI